MAQPDIPKSSTLELDDSGDSKKRQMLLYEQVCAPIIERAKLLLCLTSVAEPKGPQSSPFKLFPGISLVADSHKMEESKSEGAEQSVRQLKKLMETKSMEMIEEEDERIHSDIFAFLQQPMDPVMKTPLHVRIATILTLQQNRAMDRAYGLEIFQKMLSCSSSVSECRHHILSFIAVAFQEHKTEKLSQTRTHIDSSELEKGIKLGIQTYSTLS